MVEIVVREYLDRPHVIRIPGKLPEIHIGSDMSMNQIINELSTEISTAEFEKFKQLYTEDSYPRVFMHQGNYLKIMDKN